jgi:uroporphyrin-III C-methyltransferase/precorrin-2 dehydrogenase/sirohydrochlorin ferrochelatase
MRRNPLPQSDGQERISALARPQISWNLSVKLAVGKIPF